MTRIDLRDGSVMRSELDHLAALTDVLHHDVRRGDVLHADTREVAHRELARRGPPGVGLRADLAELDRLRLVDQSGGERVVQLTDRGALRAAVDDQEVGAGGEVRIQLLLVRSVRSDGGDVRAELQPFPSYQRRLAPG